MKKKISILLVTLLAIITVFTGCGAKETASDTIVLKCGVKQSHVPYSQLDEDGELVGLEEDVVKEVFNRIEGYDVEFVGFDGSPALFSALQAGNVDLGSGQYAASEARREIYKFPEQYYVLSPYYLASRTEDSYQSLEDIAGQTLEFASTSYEKEIIQAYNNDHPGAEINIVDTSGDTTAADYLQQIQTGQRNVHLIYKSSYDTVQDELNLEGVTLSDEPVLVEDVYQVFNSKVDDEFIKKFDEALKSMLEDGTLSEIAIKWTGEDTISQYQDLVISVQ